MLSIGSLQYCFCLAQKLPSYTPAIPLGLLINLPRGDTEKFYNVSLWITAVVCGGEVGWVVRAPGAWVGWGSARRVGARAQRGARVSGWASEARWSGRGLGRSV